MRHASRYLNEFLTILLLFMTSISGVWASNESATNGIYGGYVGSDRWFYTMRQTAANQALIQSLSGARKLQKLPADYVEFSGMIVFPNGNPFPGGQLPDLRIVPRDTQADAVERAPTLDSKGSFYSVFKRGQTYDIFWMYYFGGREKFAEIYIEPNGPQLRKAAIEYIPAPTESNATDESRSADNKSRSADNDIAPSSDDKWTPPQSDGGWTPPQSDGGWRSPKSDGDWKSPQSDGG